MQKKFQAVKTRIVDIVVKLRRNLQSVGRKREKTTSVINEIKEMWRRYDRKRVCH